MHTSASIRPCALKRIWVTFIPKRTTEALFTFIYNFEAHRLCRGKFVIVRLDWKSWLGLKKKKRKKIKRLKNLESFDAASGAGIPSTALGSVARLDRVLGTCCTCRRGLFALVLRSFFISSPTPVFSALVLFLLAASAKYIHARVYVYMPDTLFGTKTYFIFIHLNLVSRRLLFTLSWTIKMKRIVLLQHVRPSLQGYAGRLAQCGYGQVPAEQVPGSATAVGQSPSQVHLDRWYRWGYPQQDQDSELCPKGPKR